MTKIYAHFQHILNPGESSSLRASKFVKGTVNAGGQSESGSRGSGGGYTGGHGGDYYGGGSFNSDPQGTNTVENYENGYCIIKFLHN